MKRRTGEQRLTYASPVNQSSCLHAMHVVYFVSQTDDMLFLGSEEFAVLEGNELRRLIRVQSLGTRSPLV